MFNEYIKKILPIPITKITASEDGYTYKISTYSNVLSEYGVEKNIIKRTKNNKRIASFDGWYTDITDTYSKYAFLTFRKT